MTLDDLRLVISWANDEGWVFSENDAEAYYNLDPNGYFVGEIDGKTVGSIGAVNYGDYGFIDAYLVRQEYQGKGYGTQLLNHALEYCKDCKVIGLDVVDESIKYWSKSGYKPYYRILCFERKAQGALGDNIVNIKKDISFDILKEYDLDVFGYSREKFLECLLKRDDYHALGAVKDGTLVGYGVLRKLADDEGYIIGPLSAESAQIARDLSEGLQSLIIGQTVYASFFDCNENAVELFGVKDGWSNVSDEVRLYKGGVPKTDMKRTYVPIEEFS